MNGNFAAEIGSTSPTTERVERAPRTCVGNPRPNFVGYDFLRFVIERGFFANFVGAADRSLANCS